MSQLMIPTTSYETVLQALVDAIDDCEADNGYRAVTSLQQAKHVLERVMEGNGSNFSAV